jgi:hypothetical protein
MTHADKGKYFQKHPQQTKVDAALREEILKKVSANDIKCSAAEEIAGSRHVALSAVGMAIDLLNINLIECQLGLFGYHPEKKIVQPAKEITPALKEEIEKSLVSGRLSCVAAWEIARNLNLPRMRVSAACEFLQIKVRPCQLGAF